MNIKNKIMDVLENFQGFSLENPTHRKMIAEILHSTLSDNIKTNKKDSHKNDGVYIKSETEW
jgi:hypothetical protein